MAKHTIMCPDNVAYAYAIYDASSPLATLAKLHYNPLPQLPGLKLNSQLVLVLVSTRLRDPKNHSPVNLISYYFSYDDGKDTGRRTMLVLMCLEDNRARSLDLADWD